MTSSTLGLDATPDATTTEKVVDEPVASWVARVGAFAVDVLVGVAVLVTLALVSLTAPQRSPLWWGYLAVMAVVVLAMAVNRLVLPTITGFSLGRAVAGIAVTRRDGSPVGVWRLLVRDIAHLLDTAALFIGWFWPLWDRRRRTFADLLLRTEVRPVPRPERNVRKLTAIAMIVATLICATAVGLNYWVIYRHERAVDETRQQIGEQGPRIVEQMLSYKRDTLQEDFSRAQSLTTDGYREQLIAQQQAVQKAGVDLQRVLGGEQCGADGDAGARRRCCWRCRVSAAPIRKTSSSSPRPCGWSSRRPMTASGGRRPHGAETAADECAGPMSPRRKVDAGERDFFEVVPEATAALGIVDRRRGRVAADGGRDHRGLADAGQPRERSNGPPPTTTPRWSTSASS